MPDFDAEGFVAAVERLGLLLTAVRFSDGNVRLYRWRLPDAVIHVRRIEALWAAQIGENPDRVRERGSHHETQPETLATDCQSHFHPHVTVWSLRSIF
jgi:hypothetical protein